MDKLFAWDRNVCKGKLRGLRPRDLTQLPSRVTITIAANLGRSSLAQHRAGEKRSLPAITLFRA